MNIGIVGLGVVGSACHYGFSKLGHSVSAHDIKMSTTIRDVSDSDVCFICVPTPSTEDGKCDVSIVEDVIYQIRKHNRNNIIVIKSTVEPGTTQRLINSLDSNICFVPEFLRERCSITDFTENHDLCIIGTDNNEVFEKVKLCHGSYPKKFVQLSPTEAEISKYFNNVYNASLIILANSFYEICQAYGADYSRMKNAIVNRNHIVDIYLDCNGNFRGFGGMCLPKDVRALAHLAKQKNLNVDFFQNIIDENAKYKTTCYEGMRHEPGK